MDIKDLQEIQDKHIIVQVYNLVVKVNNFKVHKGNLNLVDQDFNNKVEVENHKDLNKVENIVNLDKKNKKDNKENNSLVNHLKLVVYQKVAINLKCQ